MTEKRETTALEVGPSPTATAEVRGGLRRVSNLSQSVRTVGVSSWKTPQVQENWDGWPPSDGGPTASALGMRNPAPCSRTRTLLNLFPNDST